MWAHDRTPADRVAHLPQRVGPKLTVVSATAADWPAWERARALQYAQADLADALASFEIARKAIADSNRLFAKARHDRDLMPAHVRDCRRRHAFVSLNKARGRIVRARKALAKLADA